MNIVKTFTNSVAINQALDLMLSYPFDERPLICVTHIVYDSEHYTRGILYETILPLYRKRVILSSTSGRCVIFEDCIEKIEIYDTRRVG